MRRRIVSIAGTALVVVVFVALAVTGFTSRDDGGTATTTTAFVMESDEGTLRFDSDDDDAVVEIEGDDLEGLFSFDLDGDGSVTEGEGGSFELTSALPAGWPSDFPLPTDAELLRGSIVESETLTQRSATFRTTQSAEEAVEWYRTVLTDAGADVVVGAGETQDGTAATLSFEGPWTGFVAVSQGELLTELGVQLFDEVDAG